MPSVIYSIAYSQNCTPLNPLNYGDCTTPLGYVWTGEECVMVSGCDMQTDGDFFYDTFEECDIVCIGNVSLGDLNNDSMIDIIDIVQLVNYILHLSLIHI